MAINATTLVTVAVQAAVDLPAADQNQHYHHLHDHRLPLLSLPHQVVMNRHQLGRRLDPHHVNQIHVKMEVPVAKEMVVITTFVSVQLVSKGPIAKSIYVHNVIHMRTALADIANANMVTMATVTVVIRIRRRNQSSL